ncbi:hypothetical protein [Falsiruegeria mediterranea]
MYRMKPGVKKNPERRWALPDRVFFGNGACHILSGVYLCEPPLPGFYAERIIPGDDFAGNHIYVTDGTVAFDYHGYTIRNRLLRYYTNNWAGEYAQGWHCRLESVDFDLLNTQALNARKMLGPDQYLFDPILRAQRYLRNIDHSAARNKALQREKINLC